MAELVFLGGFCICSVFVLLKSELLVECSWELDEEAFSLHWVVFVNGLDLDVNLLFAMLFDAR